MKILNHLFTPLFLVSIFATTLMVSCQKNDMMEPAAEESTEFQETVLFQETVVKLVYGFSDQELDNFDILKMYDELTGSMTEEQLAQLHEVVKIYLEQKPAKPNGGGLNAKSSSETILPGNVVEDYFGLSIAKSGNTLFVGAGGEDKVYIYVNNNLTQTLSGTGGFGFLLASAGNWLAVAGETSQGPVAVLFKKQGNSWVEQATITSGFQFWGGTASDMAMHGNTLVLNGTNRIGTTAYSVLEIYKLTGNSWSLETTIDNGGDTFWWDIDIHGNTIVGNGGTISNSGVAINPMVYIYEKAGNSWNLTTVPFPQPGNFITRNIAIDGGTIIANTALFSRTNSYLINKSSGTWAISGTLVNPFVNDFDRKLEIENSKAVVTSPSTNQAFVFELSEGGGTLTETLTPSIGTEDPYFNFGESVLVKGNEILIGAPFSLDIPGYVFIYD